MACELFFSEQRPFVAQRIDIEELEPGKHGLEGALGHAQLVPHVQDVVLDLAFIELVWREHVVASQLAHGAKIHLVGSALTQPSQFQILDHAVFEL